MPPRQRRDSTAFLLKTLAIAFLLICLPAAAHAKQKHFYFALNLPPSLIGEGAASIISRYNDVRKAVKSQTGFDLELKTYGDWEGVVRAVERRDADFAALPGYYFAASLANPRTRVRPFVTFMSDGRISSPCCIYVKKSREILTLDQLFNARIALPDESHWVVLSRVFRDNNNPFPPAEFFEKVEIMTPESAFLALVFDKIDAVVADSLSMTYVLASDPRSRETAAVECSATLTNPLIVHHADVPAETLGKIESTLLSMHTAPAFRSVRNFFKTANGRWVPAKKEYYNDWESLIEEASKYGWVADFRASAGGTR
ncbi:MAG: PhnD/SsuA/transferrin family substrate-binding protein [bacterium]